MTTIRSCVQVHPDSNRMRSRHDPKERRYVLPLHGPERVRPAMSSHPGPISHLLLTPVLKDFPGSRISAIRRPETTMTENRDQAPETAEPGRSAEPDPLRQGRAPLMTPGAPQRVHSPVTGEQPLRGGLATASLACGIITLLLSFMTLSLAIIPFLWIFPAIPAVFPGHLARRRIRRTGEGGAGMPWPA